MIGAGAGDRALWSAEEAAAATGGRYQRPFEATGVAIDSRTLASGDLYVALAGPRFDGHDFVAHALARGAAAAMVARRPDGLATGAPLLMVDDTLSALGALGRAARARTRARIVAVTGSVGKTGTKEALRLVLSGQGATAASAGSLNNHWGLPLSLARLPRDARYGVFEMGMNHPGEIAPLARLARPHVSLITTVEAVHTAFFSSLEAIADAKAEVFTGMDVDGTAVLNRDNPLFERLVAAAKARGIERVISFGHHDDANVRVAAEDLDDTGSDVVATIDDAEIAFRVGIPGRHWVMNAVAALAVVRALSADVAAAASRLAALVPLPGRGRRVDVTLADGACIVIDESYNASPASMAAALDVLGRTRPAAGGRRIAVLGDMLELGAMAADRHAALAVPLRRSGVDLVFTAGAEMAHLWQALPARFRGGHAADAEALAPAVCAAVCAGDVVMVKGSAGSRMGVVVRALEDLSDANEGPTRGRVVNGE